MIGFADVHGASPERLDEMRKSVFADLRHVVALATESEASVRLRPYVGELASAWQTDWAFRRARLGLWGFPELEHPSTVIREHSKLTDLPGDVYDSMFERDVTLAGLWQKRVDALLALPRSVSPRDRSPKARETAQFVISALGLLPSRETLIGHWLGAVPRGVAVGELMWERISRGSLSGAWVPVRIVDRPMKRFAWHAETHALHVRRRSEAPIPAPPLKFAVNTWGSLDTPYGDGLLNRLYWSVELKKLGLKGWAIHIERFGSPLTRGRYKHRQGSSSEAEVANQKDRETLLQILTQLRTGTSIVLPEGLEVDFLEATRGGDASFGAFVSVLERGQALALLGEVDTSGLAKAPGSYAKSQVSNEVRKETVAHDAHLIGSFETDTLARWLVQLNFGLDAPVPQIIFDARDIEDRDQRRKGIDRALALGLPVPLSYLRMTLQLPEVIDGEDAYQPPATVSSAPASTPSGLSAVPSRILLAEDDELGRKVLAADADYEAVVDAFVNRTVGYVGVQRGLLIEAYDRGLSDTSLLEVVRGEQPVNNARAIETALIHGVGFSRWHLRRELADIGLATPADFSRAGLPSTAVEFWARILGLGKDWFASLGPIIKRFAFAVAGLFEGQLIADLQALVGRAVGESWDRQRWIDEVDAFYQARGVTPLARWHAELVYANNVRQAAHNTRYLQTVGNPGVHAAIPYLAWWTVDDPRVRERKAHNHAVMHRFVAAIAAPIWKVWWPIAGHNCRCGIATVTRGEAERRGYGGAEPVGPWPAVENGQLAMPDPGFEGAPDLSLLAVDLEKKVADLRDGPARAALDVLINLLGLAV